MSGSIKTYVRSIKQVSGIFNGLSIQRENEMRVVDCNSIRHVFIFDDNSCTASGKISLIKNEKTKDVL